MSEKEPITREDRARLEAAERQLDEAYRQVGQTYHSTGYALYKELEQALDHCRSILREAPSPEKGEPECPEDHFRDDPDAPEGSHCGDELCAYCNWCYGPLDPEEVEPEEEVVDPLYSLLAELRRESP